MHVLPLFCLLSLATSFTPLPNFIVPLHHPPLSLFSTKATPRLPPRKLYPLPDPSSTDSLNTSLGPSGLGLSPFISSLSSLSAGFCNWVYKVTATLPAYPAPLSTEYVAKVFSPMAKVRVSPEFRGIVDIAASATAIHGVTHGSIGPELVYNDENCIVSVLIPGKELAEADVHGSEAGNFGDGRALVPKIAARVAQLHSLELPTEMPHMLWSTVRAMLTYIAGKGGAVDELRTTVDKLQADIDELRCKEVTGHGDLKPTNVMVTPAGDVVLIDFELSGPNYRGFDLCKLFRTSKRTDNTDANMREFMSAYVREVGGEAGGRGSDCDDECADSCAASVDLLIGEAALFLPLTWFEAGVFFLFAAYCDPAQEQRWLELSRDRMGEYDKVMLEFEKRKEDYRAAKIKALAV